MTEFFQSIAAKVRKFFATVGELWNVVVLPLLGLLLWVTLVTSFTKFSATDALLVVLAFSIWYGTRRTSVVLDELSTIETYVAQILLKSVPGATSVTVTLEDGHRQVRFNHAEQQSPPRVTEYPDSADKYMPRAVDPRGPKGK